MKNNPILPLSIGALLGESNTRYRIPMYQRRYAWGQSEVEQLLYDLLNCPQDKPYYIGSLVVFKHVSTQSDRVTYEVIDGQQRLTTLMLLAAYLQIDATPEQLEFENRPKSQQALKNLFAQQALPSGQRLQANEEAAPALIGNYELIEKLFQQRENKDKQKALTEFLCKHVHIMRIEVPPHTDVAHYFEIMNNRGEQLEMHEIVKARLLSALEKKPKARATLNQVWEACANMNQYVQYSFAKGQREALFGQDCDRWQPENANALIDLLGDGQASADGFSLHAILNAPSLLKSQNSSQSERAEEQPDRFQSIVNFPNFLLLVLTLYSGQNEDNTLDDKKLLSSFDRLLLGKPDEPSKINAIQEFTGLLLRCRFLLDQYIIKRGVDDEDKLTLKRLTRSGEKINLNNAFSGPDQINRQIQMLQAAFHVSHPRQAYKYWLLGTLHWLSRQPSADPGDGTRFLDHLESLAAAFMRDLYLAPDTELTYLTIIFTHGGKARLPLSPDITQYLTYQRIKNIFVFNYLDYLLWQQNRQTSIAGTKDKIIEKFIFKSGRGAIEHYFPQSRAGEWGVTAANGNTIDAFGNLSLISHAKNSRLSDHAPFEKKRLSGYPEAIPDSIKQYLMHAQTNDQEDWEPVRMKNHENAMIDLLHSKLSSAATSNHPAQEQS